jgi:hypothetical protein
MIDLLMVTISFLLITAVWTQAARINADAHVPGRQDVEVKNDEPELQLHVDAREPSKFVLLWKQGGTTVESVDVPRQDVVGPTGLVRYPDLAAKIENEWKVRGQHTRPSDARLDQAVLHTDNTVAFNYVVGILDAIEHAHRSLQIGRRESLVPAFNVTFAAD